LSRWRSRTAREGTASKTKTSNTQFAIRCEWSGGAGRDLVIGADRSGRLLEVVVLGDDPDEEPVVIHAMALRPKFHR
jgi:hypothetical protein